MTSWRTRLLQEADTRSTRSSRRSTPAPARRARMTKSLSVGDCLGETCSSVHSLTGLAGSPGKGVRIKEGETDMEDFDTELDYESFMDNAKTNGT